MQRQHQVTIPELKARAEAINLKAMTIVRRAGVAHTTYLRALERDDCRLSTQRRLSECLEAEEMRLLRHLVKIHGVPPPE